MTDGRGEAGPKPAFVAAFDRNKKGELVPAFKPRILATKFTAEVVASLLAKRHAGAIAWTDDGGVVELVRYGDIPEKWS